MAKFLNENEINGELSKIILNAEKELILISPFIKLHVRIRDMLKSKLEMDGLGITVVYGKNEDEKTKSLSMDDVNFLKTFPNIEIRYESRLHAKYYANEETALLTSMNLYEYSHNKNIEFGIKTKKSTGEALDEKAYDFFTTVIDNSDLYFKRVPQYKETLLGFRKEYLKSVVTTDRFESSFKSATEKNEVEQSQLFGFCIRTAKKIKFDLNKPLCDEAFLEWSKFKNERYAEKYCHFSGELSDGVTSWSRPVLPKNWLKAKEIHRF